MPSGISKLVLKGGKELIGVKKKKSKKSKHKDKEAKGDGGERKGDDLDPSTSQPDHEGAATDEKAAAKEPAGFLYEKEFQFEAQRMNEGKARSTAWGASYRAPPEVLHGYDRKVTGETYEERLDLRCAKKADRMCK